MKNKLIENKWLILFSIFVILITSIPYWIGFNLQNAQYKFSGFIIGVGDGNSYLAKMMVGASGDWLFTTPYTAYPQMKFFAFIPYILLGKLAGNPELTIQFISLFHLFRWVGIIFLVFQTFYFCQQIIDRKQTSYFVTALLILGGGFGWVGVLFPGLLNDRLPLEFYSPETFGFLSVFSLPHLLFARGFLYRSFRIFLANENSLYFDKKIALGSGFSLFLSGIFQPINLFIGWFVVGAYYLVQIFQKKKIVEVIRHYLFWLIPSSVLFFYNFFSFMFDPYLSAWQDQNKIASPPVIDYLLAYGFGLIFVLIAQKKTHFSWLRDRMFLNTWLILIPVLVYFPHNLQRRLAEGVWIVFCIYIGVVLIHSKIWVKILIFFFCSMTTLLFFVGSFQSIQNISPPIYSSQSIIDIGEFLFTYSQKGDVVLAPFDESNLLPVFAPIKVITGHGPESKNLNNLTPIIDDFYQGLLSKSEIEDFLIPLNVKYLVVPKQLDVYQITNQFDPEKIIIIFENQSYVLYRIYYE